MFRLARLNYGGLDFPTVPQSTCNAEPWTQDTMNRRAQLSANELNVLEGVFWSHGPSHEALSSQLNFSKTRANAVVAGLVEAGWLDEVGLRASSGGRRAETLQLHSGLGVLLCAALGANSVEVAVLAPDLQALARHGEAIDMRAGPGIVLSRTRTLMRELLARCGRQPGQVIGIGIGVPGPVNFASGQLVEPPLMPHWDSYSIRDDFRADFEAPVWVDNDGNVMALGELWACKRGLPNFLVIKVGTGIGCGVVCHGEVYRGATSSAGDAGHICVGPHGRRCDCGNLGCVDVMAAGRHRRQRPTTRTSKMARAACASSRRPWPLRQARRSGRPCVDGLQGRAATSASNDTGFGCPGARSAW